MHLNPFIIFILVYIGYTAEHPGWRFAAGVVSFIVALDWGLHGYFYVKANRAAKAQAEAYMKLQQEIEERNERDHAKAPR